MMDQAGKLGRSVKRREKKRRDELMIQTN